MKQNNETAVFGGGCFWCTEAVFQRLKGVESVVPGYAGGHTEHPSYEDVAQQDTGHAEVVIIVFNPDVISYTQLLEVFFEVHNPSSLNRQGNDIGPEYRSIILYTSEQQKKTAEQLIANMKKRMSVVTELVPLTAFYDAESYHRNYYEKNEYQPYCQLVIGPKLEHFKQKFGKLLK